MSQAQPMIRLSNQQDVTLEVLEAACATTCRESARGKAMKRRMDLELRVKEQQKSEDVAEPSVQLCLKSTPWVAFLCHLFA